ncbi:hypothetical protein K1T71_012044 [Dendrolimus kikuchii]|uniref:Uncharacterized protein n=1 Tax=Dendrolimus kikuchii TaxID=765133 RepID=A0ACC1CKU6_9NEOP|nr:hypothetical protein K1T71_012044 [Dendrolimus kikuchii]
MCSQSNPNFDCEDFYVNIKIDIERQLERLKKLSNELNQLRVEAAFQELDMLLLLNAQDWQNISDLIGYTPERLGNISELINDEPQQP